MPVKNWFQKLPLAYGRTKGVFLHPGIPRLGREPSGDHQAVGRGLGMEAL